ncbi:CK1 family protein kinase [Histomonas meleagridis]|uniref:CK1 family protein kinase n=1 Tax=Histomonas meleagridis TaxID=135588 RepID=UPI0035597B4E|nr:CK1 family protein kinase [Histomonas meleagridis]KAH0799386.1 CK1 family protein kinase [Histomonas meleagridis]
MPAVRSFLVNAGQNPKKMSVEQRNLPSFSQGKKVSHFTIQGLVGAGGYGAIYSVIDNNNNEKYALKVESLNAEKEGLVNEIRTMYALKGNPYFPQLIDDGIFEDYRFLTMSIYGPSVCDLRHQMPEHKFSLKTGIILAIEMLKPIQELHKAGYIHCDIKPSNFLINPNAQPFVVLIDFGLSQEYINRHNGKIREPRKGVGFVGTDRYASINAHSSKRLSPRDDLMSWFYSLIEMLKGRLPWTGAGNHELVGKMKKKISRWTLCKNLPFELQRVYSHIKSLGYADTPNFDHLTKLLQKSIKKIDNGNVKLDWETMGNENWNQPEVVPIE